MTNDGLNTQPWGVPVFWLIQLKSHLSEHKHSKSFPWSWRRLKFGLYTFELYTFWSQNWQMIVIMRKQEVSRDTVRFTLVRIRCSSKLSQPIALRCENLLYHAYAIALPPSLPSSFLLSVSGIYYWFSRPGLHAQQNKQAWKVLIQTDATTPSALRCRIQTVHLTFREAWLTEEAHRSVKTKAVAGRCSECHRNNNTRKGFFPPVRAANKSCNGSSTARANPSGV